MGRPPRDLDEYLDWQERLESFAASGLDIDLFCMKEGVSRSTFYRWKERLKEGVPSEMIAERDARNRAESAEGTPPTNRARQIIGSQDRPCPLSIRTAERVCALTNARRSDRGYHG